MAFCWTGQSFPRLIGLSRCALTNCLGPHIRFCTSRSTPHTGICTSVSIRPRTCSITNFTLKFHTRVQNAAKANNNKGNRRPGEGQHQGEKSDKETK
jgi:hypothetical protein